MTPRAPVALRCVRRGGKLSFITRQRVRRNPKSAFDALRVADQRAREGRGAIPTDLIWLAADELSRFYGRKYGDDVGQEVLTQVAQETLANYDPKRSSDIIAYMKFHADKASKRSMSEGEDPERMKAKLTMRNWKKTFKKEMGRDPENLREIAQFLTDRGQPHSLEDVREVYDAARRGSISMEASTSGDGGEEDSQTVAETVTASTSIDEPEEQIARTVDAAIAQAAASTLTLEQRKFIEQYKRGFSVADIAKRMGIGKTKAFALKAEVMAHLTAPQGQ